MASEFTRTFDFYLDGYPDQSFRIVLDSATYEVRFVWNERDESWLFHLGDVGTVPTFTCKLTPFVDILAPFRYLDNVPRGNLFMFPSRNISERAGRYNVGPTAGIELAYASHNEDIEEIE